MKPTPTDQELAQAFIDGDEQAFTEIFNRYQRALKLHITGRLNIRDANEAADLLQETMIRAMNAMRFKKTVPQHFTAWLQRIAYNINVTNYRQRMYRSKLHNEYVHDAAWSVPSVEEDRAKRELIAAIQMGIAELPATQQEAVMLRFFCGLSYAEMERKLNTNDTTYRSRLLQALEHLRPKLAKARA